MVKSFYVFWLKNFNKKGEKYMIAFSVDGKTKRFQVSQFSYNGYQVNEKGMLTYKGNQLIKFE